MSIPSIRFPELSAFSLLDSGTNSGLATWARRLFLAAYFLRKQKREKALNLARVLVDNMDRRPDVFRVSADQVSHNDPANGIEFLAANSQKYIWLSLLATAYNRIGQPEMADAKLKQLEELSQTDTKALYSPAVNYAELGRFDDAITVLEKCFEMREERMMWLKVEPRFASLRGDERFQKILQTMNLGS